jgi:N-acetylmuramoyl-L-alanine amidase
MITPFLLFFAKLLIVSGLLFGYYFFFLRNNRFHQWNRYYLLATAALSLIIPFFNIPLHWDETRAATQPILRSIDIISLDNFDIEHDAGKAGNLPLPGILSIAAYSVVCLFLLAALARTLYYITRLRRRYPKEMLGDIGFYNTNEHSAPFSFFRSVFWHEALPVHTHKGQQVFRHELAHVREKHSIDKLCLEIITALFWWNPFFHLIKKELKLVHEFIADRYATSGSDALEYAELLLLHAAGSRNLETASHFFNKHLKRRIAMITVSSNPRYVYMRKLMALPLLALTFIALAFSINKNKTAVLRAPETITVAIDAGHGGEPGSGAVHNGVYEDDIVLSIAKRIEALAPARNIKIVLTRNSPANVSLPERLQIAQTNNATVFLSLHINTEEKPVAGHTQSGMQVYVSARNAPVLEGSKALGQLLIGALSDNRVAAKPDLFTRSSAGVYVLDKAAMPSVLIEMGYLTHPTDLAYITSKAGQEEIANDVLDAIAQYKAAPHKQQVITDTVKPRVWEEAKPQAGSVVVVKEKNASAENRLLVVDGTIYSGAEAKAKLSSLAPEKISTMQVWSGAKAMALFGEKGKNGVVFITTKEVPLTEGSQKKAAEIDKLLNAEALFIINGKQYTGDEAKAALDGINPRMIETIQIIGKEGATALYGSKGKNGAVAIKLKTINGQKPVIEEIRVNSNITPHNVLYIIDGKEYAYEDAVAKLEALNNLKEIKSVHVMKGTEGGKQYGDKGKNGVIEITTKKMAQ